MGGTKDRLSDRIRKWLNPKTKPDTDVCHQKLCTIDDVRDAYDRGFAYGHEAGIEKRYDSLYESAREAGYEDGYETGYGDGAEANSAEVERLATKKFNAMLKDNVIESSEGN